MRQIAAPIIKKQSLLNVEKYPFLNIPFKRLFSPMFEPQTYYMYIESNRHINMPREQRVFMSGDYS